MGIRITKVMGYGLTDLKVRKGKIVDSRINPEGMMFNKSYSTEGFSKWCAEKYESLKAGETLNGKIDFYLEMEAIKKHQKTRLLETVQCQTEFNSKILCITPISSLDQWYRHDDTIDYYEAGTKIRNKVKLLKHGIFPYDCLYMHRETKSPIQYELAAAFHRLEPEFKKERTLMAKLMGFKSQRDCEQNLALKVPSPIHMLCEYGKMFTDSDTVYRLKPMIYTFWC